MRRAIALLVVVLSAVAVATLVLTSTSGTATDDAVAKYARAWAAGDYDAMHALISPESQARFSTARVKELSEQARDTATVVSIHTGDPEKAGLGWSVPVQIATRAFGTIKTTLTLPVSGDGSNARVKWAENLAFPGIPVGGTLSRDTTMPARASLLARDGTPLAQGTARSSPLGAAATAAVGSLDAVPESQTRRYYALGYPDTAQIGSSGLERIFEKRLAGKPGGSLRAGGLLLGSAKPRRAKAVRTTIAPDVQQSALTALGGRLGGIVAVQPRTGEILGFAGIAFSGLQPPGSTFKIVTLSAALESGAAKLSDNFTPAASATLSGVELENADREVCGGTLLQSFAESCNSVFAPLGAKVGGEKLVKTAEAFGFNSAPSIPGAATSRIPAADKLRDDLAVGSSAIGQGTVEATALQMATVAATIGLRGRRPTLTLDGADLGEPAKTVPTIGEDTARKVERAMLAVVNQGTGSLAAIPAGKVAGKTGTAELKATQECKPEDQPQTPATTTNPDGSVTTTPAIIDPDLDPCPEKDDPTDTDAWFAAYAPAGAPRVAVGVLLVASGAGRDTAAPAARAVMLAALK